MRWIARVFVSAAVRRIAVICVLALLGWLGVGTARATAVCSPGGTCDAGAAYQDCMSGLSQYVATRLSANARAKVTSQVCEYTTGYSGAVGYAWYWGKAIIPGSFYDSGIKSYFLATRTCGSRADTVAPGIRGFGGLRNGSITCEGGCQVGWFNNGDGTFTGKASVLGATCESVGDASICDGLPGYYWNGASLSCELPEVECPAGQSPKADNTCGDDPCPIGMVLGPDGTCKNEKNECPAGNVKSPTGQCLPGEGQCAAGEARGKDGTCKRDSDGDGTPDNEDDDPDNDTTEDSFSGGDDCNAPPGCNGNPIMCGQARIQWRIDCNTRRNVNISGGACNAMPICTGKECNAMEYSQLLQQWRTACAVEKLAAKSDAGGAPGDNSDLIQYLNSGGALNPDAFGAGEVGGGTGWGDPDGDEDYQPDSQGMGYSRSCPTIPPVSVFGTTISFNMTPMCQWFGLAGTLVLILAGLACVRIVNGGIS